MDPSVDQVAITWLACNQPTRDRVLIIDTCLVIVQLSIGASTKAGNPGTDNEN